jgi:hypothetical protein
MARKIRRVTVQKIKRAYWDGFHDCTLIVLVVVIFIFILTSKV